MVSKNVNQATMNYQSRGVFLALALITLFQQASSFVAPQSTVKTGLLPAYHQPGQPRLSDEFRATLASLEGSSDFSTSQNEVEDLKKQIRQEGGLFTVRTKAGAFNLYTLYSFAWALFFGGPWYLGLVLYQFFQFVTRNRFDPQRKIPILISHTWGWLWLRATQSFPRCENREILDKFYEENRCAMFVANHNSFLDIVYLGLAIGWRNYKWVSKVELGKVPALGKAIKVGGSLMVDRKDKRSGLKTLKRGIQYLKDGIHLCTFPEGTRSTDGRVMPFKNGAFKMAQKAGVPVIPVSIVGLHKVYPPHWIFPCRPARRIAKVVFHQPIESVGKTEEELADAVRKAMIAGLPEEQRPLDGK